MDNNTLKFIIEEDLPVRSVRKHMMEYLRKDYKDIMITDWAHIKDEIFICDLFFRIISYLLRIYYWSDLIPMLREHWIFQIYVLYNDIPRQRGRKNKLPSKNMIYKTICRAFDEYDILNSNLKDCIRGLPGYDKLPEVIVREDGIEFCKKYIDWLSEKLSIYGKVEENEIKEIINKLINER